MKKKKLILRDPFKITHTAEQAKIHLLFLYQLREKDKIKMLLSATAAVISVIRHFLSMGVLPHWISTSFTHQNITPISREVL